MSGARPFSIVCLSSQEWRVDLPTNRQQIMLRAASRGHAVVFVETGHFLGRHLWSLLRTGFPRSLASRLFSAEEVSAGIRVRKALNVFPWGHKYGLPSRLNSALTARLLRHRLDDLPKPVVLWLYDPCAAPMVGSCDEAFAVYDCVDDYREQTNGDRHRRALVSAADEEAARLSRLVFATTRPLHERHRRVNAATHLVPNAGDFRHFAPASDRAFAAPDVRDLARPVVGFAGNFVPAKVDFALLDAVARERPDWTLVLVGPARDAAEHALRRLTQLPNVRWLGAKAYEELPRFVAAFDVALIPYVANAYTRSCFPLKVYEYLAAGKPVVASGLPELAGMEPDVVLAARPAEFVAAVEAALERGQQSDRARRMELAAANTWERRAGRLLELVGAQLHG